MKKSCKFISSILSAAFVMNLVGPVVSTVRASADERIISMSETIKEGLETFSPSIDISRYSVKPEEAQIIGDVVQYVLEDPELFYVDISGNGGTSQISVTATIDPNTQEVICKDVVFNYNNTLEDVAPLREEFAAKADDIISNVITDDMTELEKALKLHDYIVLHTVYDTQETLPDLNGGSSAYDILVSGNGVCAGYAKAYKYLLGKVGIESVVVTSSAMNHAWNLVNIDNEWYHVDTTWDDPVPDSIGRVNHKYFMLSDAAIQQTNDIRKYSHYNWESKGFEATSTKYDDTFWSDVDTELFIQDGKIYFINSSGEYSVYTESTGQVANNISIDDARWNEWGNPNAYFLGKYTSMIVINNIVYYNTPEMIYSMHLDGSWKQGLLYVNPQENDGYMYGLILQDNKVYAVVKQHPSDEGKLVELNLGIEKDIEENQEYLSYVQQVFKAIADMKDGDKATFDMEQETEKILPAQTIETMKGKKIQVVLDLGDYQWQINSQNIANEESRDLNLEIKQDQGMIPGEMLAGITPNGTSCVELNLTHNGKFGLTAGITYNVGEEFKDNVATLYYYNEANSKMDKLDNMIVDRNGNIDISLEHASSYAVVLKDMRMPTDPVIEDDPKPPETTEDMINETVTSIEAPENLTTDNSEITAPSESFGNDVNVEVTEDDQTPDIMVGDINHDGIVDMMDLTLISLYCLGDKTLSDVEILAADVTGDGEVDLTDLASIKQFVMNIISSFR